MSSALTWSTAGWLVALGTALGLDSVTVGQTMLSRPLVGATVAGTVCGAPAAGLLAGVLLEAVALETLPVGASRYPDWAPAGVAAGAIAASAEPLAPAVALAVLVGLMVAWVSGASMISLRHANGRRLEAQQSRLAAGSAAAARGLVWAGIGGDVVRAAVVAVLGVAVVPMAAWAAARWQLDPFTTMAVTAVAALMVTASSTRQMFHAAHGARSAFVAAFVVGVCVLVVQWR
jgi:mannose/fructose/N-acetylgalactosamine-specific phosphotransferase system component IIC